MNKVVVLVVLIIIAIIAAVVAYTVTRGPKGARDYTKEAGGAGRGAPQASGPSQPMPTQPAKGL